MDARPALDALRALRSKNAALLMHAFAQVGDGAGGRLWGAKGGAIGVAIDGTKVLINASKRVAVGRGHSELSRGAGSGDCRAGGQG